MTVNNTPNAISIRLNWKDGPADKIAIVGVGGGIALLGAATLWTIARLCR